MSNTDKNTDLEAMSFEEAMAELESVVQRLEVGNVALEDSISLYERGALLRSHCESKLKRAQARIEKLSLSSDGVPEATAPLDEA